MTLPTESKARKETPIFSGVLKYFPLALAAVARVSWKGNEKHNPGEPLHWSRDKSADHLDCVARHLVEAGTLDDDGDRHSAKMAWRALANLEIELEHAQSARGDALGVGESNSAIPRRPIAYISGPMRGWQITNGGPNFAAFDKAKVLLGREGFEVISPADMDRNLDQGEQSSDVYVERDIAALLHIARAKIPGSCIVMIADWQLSTGARAERTVAQWLQLPIRYIEEFA